MPLEIFETVLASFLPVSTLIHLSQVHSVFQTVFGKVHMRFWQDIYNQRITGEIENPLRETLNPSFILSINHPLRNYGNNIKPFLALPFERGCQLCNRARIRNVRWEFYDYVTLVWKREEESS